MSSHETQAFDTDTSHDNFKGTLAENGAVQCVFSTQENIKVGTGTTTRRHLSKLYWFVEQTSDDQFSARKINGKNVPFGEATPLGLTDLLENFLPEIEFWEDHVIPAMQELEDLLENGELDREDGKLYSAERSFKKALTIEEHNVRALFNLGLIYLELDDKAKARDMMNELLKLKTPFQGKDQHLFNDLGISLRKNGLYDEAVAYYGHALLFIQDDEHLFYNLARVHYERGDWAECVKALKRCRQLDPDLAPANDLCDLLYEMSNNKTLCERHDKPPIPNDIATAIMGVHAMEGTSRSRTGGRSPEKDRARTSGVITIESQSRKK